MPTPPAQLLPSENFSSFKIEAARDCSTREHQSQLLPGIRVSLVDLPRLIAAGCFTEARSCTARGEDKEENLLIDKRYFN